MLDTMPLWGQHPPSVDCRRSSDDVHLLCGCVSLGRQAPVEASQDRPQGLHFLLASPSRLRHPATSSGSDFGLLRERDRELVMLTSDSGVQTPMGSDHQAATADADFRWLRPASISLQVAYLLLQYTVYLVWLSPHPPALSPTIL